MGRIWRVRAWLSINKKYMTTHWNMNTFEYESFAINGSLSTLGWSILYRILFRYSFFIICIIHLESSFFFFLNICYLWPGLRNACLIRGGECSYPPKKNITFDRKMWYLKCSILMSHISCHIWFCLIIFSTNKCRVFRWERILW